MKCETRLRRIAKSHTESEVSSAVFDDDKLVVANPPTPSFF
jgi:hypothetical protein